MPRFISPYSLKWSLNTSSLQLKLGQNSSWNVFAILIFLDPPPPPSFQETAIAFLLKETTLKKLKPARNTHFPRKAYLIPWIFKLLPADPVAEVRKCVEQSRSLYRTGRGKFMQLCPDFIYRFISAYYVLFFQPWTSSASSAEPSFFWFLYTVKPVFSGHKPNGH